MNVFIAHSARDRELVADVIEQLKRDGQNVYEPSQEIFGETALSRISAAIRSADIFIGLVTSPSSNIFYELGLAAGANIPILVAAKPGENIPADLGSVPYVRLTGDAYHDTQTIARRIREFGGPPPPRAVARKSSEAILREAANDPAFLESLAPDVFERLVAELFQERGYTFTMTSPTRDMGVDFVVTAPGSRDRIVVELKKYSRQSRVSVATVSQLAQICTDMGASAGLLVSTSGFTASALARAVGTPIVLKKLEEILDAKSLEEVLGIPSSKPGENDSAGK
ncbi:MAG TPA: restriction endonuclease [Rhizomicrobium sp.]